MEDKEIVNLYWARSEAAITETSSKYGSYCKKIAFNILHSNEDSEECVSDTYMAAWNAMPESRPERLAAFLGKITRNISLNRYDHNRAKKRNSEFDVILSELEDCLCAPDDVQSRYEEGETSAAISAFLRGIDRETRIVFVRRYWYADSIADLAGSLGMSESKVKSMLFRVRKKLKAHLEEEGILL